MRITNAITGVARLSRAGRMLTAVAAIGAASISMAGCGTQATQTAAAQEAAAAVQAADAQAVVAHVAGSSHGYAAVRLSVGANRGFGPARTVILPRGWRAQVWALVGGARLEAWTPGGQLLVSSPGSGTIVELRPRGSRPPVQRTIVSGLNAPQGMAFDRLGGRELLYVAESDQLDRYAWNGATVGSRTVIAAGLPDGGSHPLKNVVVGPDHTVYVDIGSATNASPPANTGAFPRAAVIAFTPGGRHRVLATGVRNGDGLSFAPDGTLWTAVNERDDIGYPFHRGYGGQADAYGNTIQAYVDEHPPDELARLTAGRDLGWPYCDPDPDLRPGSPASARRYGEMPFDADTQTNPGGSRLNCARLARIERGLPAHSAPLGFDFLKGSRLPAPWSGGAVVAVHGSWDRQPPRAPAVLWLPWQSGARTLGNPITLMGGFQSADGNRWGRPVDAVPGPDGALYVSDDTAGAIYRLVAPRG